MTLTPAESSSQVFDIDQQITSTMRVEHPDAQGFIFRLDQLNAPYVPPDEIEVEGGHEVLRPPKLGKGANAGGIDTAIQELTGPLVAGSSGINFDGLGNGIGGPNGTFTVNSVPPDTNLAVGTTQIVETVNSGFAVFSKTTGAVIAGPYNIQALWSTLPANSPCTGTVSGDAGVSMSDPVAVHDQFAQRWLVTVLALPYNSSGSLVSPFYHCIAISATDDATGSWSAFEYNPGSMTGNTSYLPDYPKMNVWRDSYTFTYDQYNSGGTTYEYGEVCGIDRNGLLTNGTGTIICFKTPNTSSDYAMLPAYADGSTYPPLQTSGTAGTDTCSTSSPCQPQTFVLQANSTASTATTLYYYRVHYNFTTTSHSAVSTRGSITVTSYNQATCSNTQQCVPQPTPVNNTSGYTTQYKLDTLAYHVMYRLPYRNFGSYESVVANETVKNGSNSNTAVRWYELRGLNSTTGTGTPTVQQQSTFAPDTTLYRWMGSIAADHNNNMLLGYSGSSSSVFPSLYFTGRLAADTASTMETETQVYAGQNSQTGSSSSPYGYRWGDYSSMQLDPDDCTFWYSQEYMKTAGEFNWNGRIANWNFGSANCSDSAAITLPIPNAESGSTLTSATATFYWTIGSGSPTGYTLTVGSSQGGSDYFTGTYSAGTYTATVSTLPTDGSTFWVRLATTGGAGGYNDYQYTAPNLKTAQTITFTTSAPSSAAYNSSFGVAATASSGLTVAFTGSGVCIAVDNGNGTANYTMTSGTGTCSVIANQAGNATYSAAPTVTQSVTATKLANSVTFTTAPPANAVYGSNFTVAASGLGSGAITYTSSGACTNSGATYTMTSGTGTCTVTASQATDSNYNAGSASAGVSATKASQTITFTTAAPASAEYGSSFTVAATASSGLAVSFTSAGACSNVGAIYTMTASSGTCSVLADQAGNSNYSAAPEASETVNATNANGGVGVGSSLNPSVYGQSVTFTATITSDTGQVKGHRNGRKPMTVTGSVTWSSNTGCGTTSITSVGSGSGTATCTTSTLAVGTDTVEADYSGDANHNAGSGTVSQVVNSSNGNVTVTSGLNPSAYGQSVTFTATINGDYGLLKHRNGAKPMDVTGTVTFTQPYIGWSCTSAVTPGNPGVASCTTSILPVNAVDPVTATYSGDSNHSGGSATVNQEVDAASVGVDVTSGANPSTFGQSVTFTATLTGQYGQVKGRKPGKNGTKPMDVTGVVTWSANTGCAGSNIVSGAATCTTFEPRRRD